MRVAARALMGMARVTWRWLREWSGDAAYERYCRRAIARGGTQARIPSPEQFYLESIQRRFSRPSRCC
jgi:hypothetical protein